MKRALTIMVAILSLSQTLLASDKLGLKTFVIDPGHGGKDPGAVSMDNKSYEKTFTLDIATRLCNKVRAAYPDVKVIMTRDDDTFISLNKRADIANKADADLFMSVHINASATTSANGYSVHVLGKSHKANTDIYRLNLEMVKRENSVIKLDDDYNPATAGFDPSNPESYIFMTMMQSAHLEQSIQFAQDIIDQLDGGPIVKDRGVSQDPFYVLWKTTMPAVLVELGFISNDDDLAQLKHEKKRDELAEALFQAFVKYKRDYDASMSIAASAPVSTPASTQPVVDNSASTPKVDKPVENVETKQMYGLQIFTVGAPVEEGDKRLHGYKPLIIKSGSKYRHIICISGTKDEAASHKEAVKAWWPDCYVVKVDVTTE